MLYIQVRRLFRGESVRAGSALWLFTAAILVGRPALAQPLDPNQFGSVGTLNVAGGTLNINTDTLSMSGAATFGGFLHSQPSGPAIAVFNFDNVNIDIGTQVVISGSRPLAILSKDSMTIRVPLDLNGEGGGTNLVGGAGKLGGGSGGSGGYVSGSGFMPGFAGSGPGGGGGGTASNDSRGGAGGGFGGTGGASSYVFNLDGALVSGGPQYGNLWNELVGGSGGGGGATNSSFNGVGGGAGGGAIALIADG